MSYTNGSLLECLRKVPSGNWKGIRIDVPEDHEHFVLPMLRGSMLKGHFELSSFLHSPVYVQTAPLMSYPAVRAKLASALLHEVAEDQGSFWGFDAVVAMANGATLLGCEIARNLSARILYAESCNGEIKLRRGQILQDTDRVLLVDNVVTTGGAILKATQEIRGRFGCKRIDLATLINRTPDTFEGLENLSSLAYVGAPIYAAEECPLCQQEVPLIKNSEAKDLCPWRTERPA